MNECVVYTEYRSTVRINSGSDNWILSLLRTALYCIVLFIVAWRVLHG